MQPTILRYLEEMDRLELESRVVAIDSQGGRDVVILDQSIFYPQGGGQPYDHGTMTSDADKFRVDEVRSVDGVVRHIGNFVSGSFSEAQIVLSQVDAARRLLNNRVHSAGHVVDMAITAMELGWAPGKGYHFPEGPYVEYSGSLDGLDPEKLKSEIATRSGELVRAGIETHVRFVSVEEMRRLCRFVPENLPEGKPMRIVFYGDFGVPCGGTHVARLDDIGPIIIRKLKESRGVVRVSYDVTHST